MATVIVRLITDEGGTRIKATAAKIEFTSERIYNRPGNARKAALRLIEELNIVAGTEIAVVQTRR